MKIARIVVHPDERGLITGKDLGNVFEKGVVYEFFEMMGEIIIRKKGKSCITSDMHPNWNNSAIDHIENGEYLFTEKEHEFRIENKKT